MQQDFLFSRFIKNVKEKKKSGTVNLKDWKKNLFGLEKRLEKKQS